MKKTTKEVILQTSNIPVIILSYGNFFPDTVTHFSRRISIAPMLDWTDRFFRYFFRQISRQAWLYTEMVTTGALLHNTPERFLRHDECEQPLALQLGGSDPKALTRCAKMAEVRGYNEVNLNVGCPSDRVQSGRFGACLMREPHLVADCVKAMQDGVTIPITVKHRIGLDQEEDYSFLAEFVNTISQAGCKTFIVHARNAILKGLSPKENREIPPLKYQYVYQLKKDFPALEIILNGGVKTWAEVEHHLLYVDGVMIGREAYHHPYLFADCDERFYKTPNPSLNREDVIKNVQPFMANTLKEGVPIRHLIKPLLGLYQGQPGARTWRRLLSDPRTLQEADEKIVAKILKDMIYK